MNKKQAMLLEALNYILSLIDKVEDIEKLKQAVGLIIKQIKK